MPTAFILINTKPASMPEVTKAVRAVKRVEQAEMVYGVYDIVAKLKVETMDELKQVIANRIRAIPGIQTTQTVLVVHKARPLSGFYSALVDVRKIEMGFSPKS